jgi:hypothetical protein
VKGLWNHGQQDKKQDQQDGIGQEIYFNQIPEFPFFIQ